MRVCRLVAVILLLAGLIVAGVGLVGRRGVGPAPRTEAEIAGAHFVAAETVGGTIECPVAGLATWQDLWSRPLPGCSLGDGWLAPRAWGSTSWGPSASFTVELDAPGERTLEIEIRAADTLPPDGEQSATLSVNGLEQGRFEVPTHWSLVSLAVPEGALRVGRNDFRLDFADWRARGSEGPRPGGEALAAQVRRLTLRPAPSTGPAPADRPVGPAIWDAEAHAFVAAAPGTLVLPVHAPAGARRLRLDIRPSRGVDRRAATARLRLEDLDGDDRREGRIDRFPAIGAARLRLDVDDLSGRWLLLTLELEPAGGSLVVPPPVFELDRAGAAPPATPTATAPPLARPDIVLIILDAARADHFGHAGYDRETTPFIDALAGESLVFRHAFALAPYTLCSVPTILTGLDFVGHGVVRHEQVLADEAMTLAESLGQAGYRTACFSATPNNSRGLGFDQGYEVFRELWTEGPVSTIRRPHYLARRVVEWLDATAADDRPLHLQLHMIPPHAPYDPPPPFDVFSDPAYGGTCDGYDRTLGPVDSRARALEPGCLEHLVDLYDGNLRLADDATRVVLEALARRPRWRDTVVLVTSDHGEAFMEHGRLEHNSTVFGEMLHVPFVLRLPADRAATGVDTDRLVSLADVAPTLLGLAGIEPPAGGAGVDLLADGPPKRGRYLVSRNANNPPIAGIRTLRWSAVLDIAGSVALYDLAADPGETTSVAAGQPARLAGLGLLATRRLSQPPRLATGDAETEIGERERELLETLGYVR
ncbi:MAG: sulfatase [Thermoanaerobaculales bacterium]|jgi:arylsulfatase|nr:sulfatase [Thermoanaerobaculales bacterium]